MKSILLLALLSNFTFAQMSQGGAVAMPLIAAHGTVALSVTEETTEPEDELTEKEMHSRRMARPGNFHSGYEGLSEVVDAVGRVENPDLGGGPGMAVSATITLIAPNLAIVAAHTVTSRKGGEWKMEGAFAVFEIIDKNGRSTKIKRDLKPLDCSYSNSWRYSYNSFLEEQLSPEKKEQWDSLSFEDKDSVKKADGFSHHFPSVDENGYFKGKQHVDWAIIKVDPPVYEINPVQIKKTDFEQNVAQIDYSIRKYQDGSPFPKGKTVEIGRIIFKSSSTLDTNLGSFGGGSGGPGFQRAEDNSFALTMIFSRSPKTNGIDGRPGRSYHTSSFEFKRDVERAIEEYPVEEEEG